MLKKFFGGGGWIIAQFGLRGKLAEIVILEKLICNNMMLYVLYMLYMDLLLHGSYTRLLCTLIK